MAWSGLGDLGEVGWGEPDTPLASWWGRGGGGCSWHVGVEWDWVVKSEWSEAGVAGVGRGRAGWGQRAIFLASRTGPSSSSLRSLHLVDDEQRNGGVG